jgi:two-component system sensor histidine kinase UhpB
LTVRDDGRGLNGRWSAGKGMRGMRERALLIGAELSVDSPPQGGVEVRLTLPAHEARR